MRREEEKNEVVMNKQYLYKYKSKQSVALEPINEVDSLSFAEQDDPRETLAETGKGGSQVYKMKLSAANPSVLNPEASGYEEVLIPDDDPLLSETYGSTFSRHGLSKKDKKIHELCLKVQEKDYQLIQLHSAMDQDKREIDLLQREIKDLNRQITLIKEERDELARKLKEQKEDTDKKFDTQQQQIDRLEALVNVQQQLKKNRKSTISEESKKLSSLDSNLVILNFYWLYRLRE